MDESHQGKLFSALKTSYEMGLFSLLQVMGLIRLQNAVYIHN